MTCESHARTHTHAHACALPCSSVTFHSSAPDFQSSAPPHGGLQPITCPDPACCSSPAGSSCNSAAANSRQRERSGIIARNARLCHPWKRGGGGRRGGWGAGSPVINPAAHLLAINICKDPASQGERRGSGRRGTCSGVTGGAARWREQELSL